MHKQHLVEHDRYVDDKNVEPDFVSSSLCREAADYDVVFGLFCHADKTAQKMRLKSRLRCSIDKHFFSFKN